MAFMVASVMSFYSHRFDEVMALPVRVFWLLVDQIPRIEAHRAKRALSITACSQDAKAFQEMNKALDSEIGDVVVGEVSTGKKVHPNEIPIPSKEEQENAWATLASLM